MTARFRFNLMSVTILAVMIVNALWAAPVLADDGPPPTETPVETPTAPTEEPTPIAEQLHELPEGTEVVVLNEDGEALPLASNEAAHIIAGGDPQWCPVGVTPGSATCTTAGQTSFAGLLAELSTYNSGAGPNKAGVIWIEGSYQSGSALNDPGITSFTLDGLTLTEMAKYALTFQGGWTGTGKVVDQFNPSEFNASLSILDWTGAVTLNDLLITGATVNPNTGTSGTSALLVESKQAITLNRVQVSDNGGTLNGADLNNQTSPTLAPIAVNESIFNNNNGSGLLVYSIGAITIRNLTANDNGADDGNNFEYGAFITNWLAVDANKPVTLSGMNQFKGNLGSGLYITSFGAVSLNNITAYANDDVTDGDGGDGSGVIVAASLSIKMTGNNLINYNQVNGLDLSSDGTITLNNINASNNGAAGAILDNCINPTQYAACTVLAKAVTLTGTNIFNNNGFEGLVVQSGGNITISNITASGNGSFGAFLDNCVINGNLSTSTCNNALRTISITTPATFLDNADDGLHILSSGAVTLKGLTANSNNDQGVYIDNRGTLSKPQSVTLSGTNTINDNDNIGLLILSYGKVSLNNITANNNGQTDSNGIGVYIDNRAGMDGPDVGSEVDHSVLITRQSITLTGNNTFNGNYSGGLYLWSVGDVTLSNITAIGNGLANASDGVHIENEVAWNPNGGAEKQYAAKVTLNGFGIFQGNGDEGLQIFSRGAIQLSNVTANDNSDVGVWANNGFITTMATRQAMTFSGVNTFNGNNGGGAMLYSFGTITLSNVIARGNTDPGLTGAGDGVFINNDQAWSPNGVATMYAANVVISGYGNFVDNADEGLDIRSRGAVTLSNLTANDNVDVGVYVSNANTPGMLVRQAITFSGINTFNNNDGGGAMLFSFGAVTLSNVTAIGNTGTGSTGVGDGVYINNDQNWLPNGVPTYYAANIIISGYGYFEDNSEDGLDILSKGMVTLAAITANGNLDDGVFMNNVGDSTPQNVTFTGLNNFNGNGGDGLIVQTDGKIAISNLNAIGNTGNGASLDNFNSAKLNKFMGVTLTGVSSFQLNQGANGLYIYSDGAVVLSNINADDNTGNGVQVITTKALTLLCANAYSNTGTGFLLTSGAGALMTLKGVTTYGNGTNETLTYDPGKLVRTWTCP